MTCQGISSESAVRYSHGVRVGNWFEEMCLKEDKVRNFRKQFDRGGLVVNKARSLFDTFNKEITLGAPKQHVHFGAIFQFTPVYMNLANMDTSDLNPALSVNIKEDTIRYSTTISEECEMTISSSVLPTLRNSFRIVSADENSSENSSDLKYGQHFRLQCIEPVDDPLWVYSAPKLCNLSQTVNTTYSSQKHGELNLAVGLVHRKNCGPGRDMPCAFANWFCVDVDPLNRFEIEGEAIPSNKPVVIVHAATNKNLAAENVVVNTLFGPEFLVSVQTYTNCYKRETWKNLWRISNGHHHHQSNAHKVE